MKVIMALIIFALGIAGCEKTVKDTPPVEGKYTGTFERIRGMGSTESANVSLTFSNHNVSGTSDKAKFPAICNGTYSISGNEIRFTNGCVWTADFDWSLILMNDYTVRQNGDSLEIKREYPGQMTDVYRLRKDQE